MKIRIALIATCMLCLNVMPMALGACVAGEILPSTPIRLKASWYSRKDLVRDGQDKRTNFIMANGEVFYDSSMVCASWDFPLNALVRVTNISRGDSVIVRVSDRTARRFKGKRIDLSKGAMQALGGQRALKKRLLQVSVEEVK